MASVVASEDQSWVRRTGGPALRVLRVLLTASISSMSQETCSSVDEAIGKEISLLDEDADLSHLTYMKEAQSLGKIRVRGSDAEVEWSLKAARRAGEFNYMMDNVPPEDGVYPAPEVTAKVLGALAEMCEAEYAPPSLEQQSVSELLDLIQGAIFLRVCPEYAQRAFASQLAGKHTQELRNLLNVTDDFASAVERKAALAEAAFLPEEYGVPPSGAADPPALHPQPSLSGLRVNDDTMEVALAYVEVSILVNLKGLSQRWRALVRRVLCSRLSCRCEAQSSPTQIADITDLDVELLNRAGRPWDVAVAGRLLPGLEQLRGFGFTVNVAAVRVADLRGGQMRDLAKKGSAIRMCITGEGEPPLELVLAAIACAGSGLVCGIPVEAMRTGSMTTLDLRESRLGIEGAMLVATLVPAMAELTKMSLAQNNLQEEGTKAICEALEGNKTLKELDISGDPYGSSNIGGSAGAKHVAKMLGVSAELTKIE